MKKTVLTTFILSLIFIVAGSLSAQDSAQVVTENLADFLAKNNLLPQQTEDGLYYDILEKGNGRVPKTGEYVKINYVGKLLDGTVFDQSEMGEPFVFQLGYRQVIRGWDKGIPLLQEKGKAVLYVPPTLAYGRFGAGKMIPPNASLIFEVELEEVMDFDAYDKYMVELEKKERAAYEQHQKDQFVQDKKLIQDYAISNKIKTKRTNSGLSYGITKKGKGDTAQPGQILSVEYEGYLADGTMFDSNKGKELFTFTLGKGKVLDGWEEGLQFFKQGGEGWLLIPSIMAYGPLGIEEEINGKMLVIPPDSVLIFKVKVVKIEEGEKMTNQ